MANGLIQGAAASGTTKDQAEKQIEEILQAQEKSASLIDQLRGKLFKFTYKGWTGVQSVVVGGEDYDSTAKACTEYCAKYKLRYIMLENFIFDLNKLPIEKGRPRQLAPEEDKDFNANRPSSLADVHIERASLPILETEKGA
jgi:hypothetical protein